LKFVSIIIPAFNRENLIAETLETVLHQSYPYWEALVVDDGSDDNTCGVVESYTKKDERIRLIRRSREPKGGSVCRNIGIENAKGSYIIFLDSDDILVPTCLQKRVEFLNTNPELDFAVFQMGIFNEKGILPGKKIVRKSDNYLYAYLRHNLPWAITCPIWKTSFIKKHIRGYNETYPRLQDPEFNTRCLLVKGVRFKVISESEPDCYYRSHSDKVFNVTILLAGFKIYIDEFSETVKFREDAEICMRQLEYCYIEAIRGFYSYYNCHHHSASIHQVNELKKISKKKQIISLQTYSLTGVLVSLYKIKLPVIPGGKYILRLVMKLIKMS
jgi:glycosyltransferase involved in cell wall biosynthesis